MDVQTDGLTEGRTDGWMDRQTDGQTKHPVFYRTSSLWSAAQQIAKSRARVLLKLIVFGPLVK